MKIENTVIIPASVEAVWACLMDNDTLRNSLPGCTALSRKPEGGLEARFEIRFGFVKRDFTAHIARKDIQKPQSIAFVGRVGQRHNARAQLTLEPEGNGTKLKYEITADVKLGSSGLGSFVVKSTATRIINDFVSRLGKAAAATA